MVRVLVVGPGDERTATLEETLRARSHSVVVSNDLGHAALLQRMFKPDIVLSPRLMGPAERKTLTTTTPTPIALMVDLHPGGQVTLVAEGLARVLPAQPTPTQLETLLGSPLAKERPVARLVGQFALTSPTGTVVLHEPDGSTLIAELVVQNGKVTQTRRGPDLRTLLGREEPLTASFHAGIADDAGDDEDFDLAFDDEEEDPVTPIPPAMRAAALSRLGPVRVLVADDDRDWLRSQAALLRVQGYEVETAIDGDEALQTALRSLPDVIVADARMTGSSGWDLLAMVRARARLRETPVLLTAYDGGWLTRLQRAGCGADAIVEKGLKPERLFVTIDRIVAPTRDVGVAVEVAKAQSPLDARLRGAGPHTLLRQLTARRFSGRVTLAAGDARFLLVVHDGGLVFARVTAGGRTQMHRDAIAALLQVGAVGFSLLLDESVGPAKGPLDDVVADAAAAVDAVSDGAYVAALADGHQLVVRSELLATYRLACDRSARPIVDQIASGRDARDLLTRGVDPVLLDRVVADLFRKGAVRTW